MKFKRILEFCATANSNTGDKDIRVHIPNAIKLVPQIIGEYEDLLSRLDQLAWETVKKKLLERTIRDDLRGWAQFYDTFAEVGGFCHLLDLGYTNIRFISVAEGMRTPDIEATSPNKEKCLLEAKNIGFSDDERNYILNNTKKLGAGEALIVRSVIQGMPEPLKNKIQAKVISAKEQLSTYLPSDATIEKIVYLTIQLDTHMYLDMRNYAEVINFINRLVRNEHEVKIEIGKLSAI